MYSQEQLVIWVDKGQQLYSRINKFCNFGVLIQNNTGSYLQRISMDLFGPPQVRISSPHKDLGVMYDGMRRRAVYRVVPNQIGVFTLTVSVNVNRVQAGVLSINLNVGTGSPLAQQQRGAIYGSQPPMVSQQEVKQPRSIFDHAYDSAKKCPKCGEKIETNSRFCANCENDLAKDLGAIAHPNICPNCGSSVTKGVKFCSECGSKVEYS